MHYKPAHFTSHLTYTLCTKPYNYLPKQGKEMNRVEEVTANVLISTSSSCECVYVTGEYKSLKHFL